MTKKTWKKLSVKGWKRREDGSQSLRLFSMFLMLSALKSKWILISFMKRDKVLISTLIRLVIYQTQLLLLDYL